VEEGVDVVVTVVVFSLFSDESLPHCADGNGLFNVKTSA